MIPFLCPDSHKILMTFVKAVCLKQKRVLLQQCNQQSGDSEQMDCEVLTDSGQTVECEVLTGRGQTVECEVLTDSGQTVECEVLTDSGHNDTERRDGTL